MENKNILNISNNKEFMEALPNTNKVKCVKCDKIILRTSWNNHIKSRGHLEESKREESSQHQIWRERANSKRQQLIKYIGIDEVRRMERERKQRNRKAAIKLNKQKEEEKQEDGGAPSEEDDENTRRKLVDKLYEANPNSIIPGKEGKAIKKNTLMLYMERLDILYKKINGSTVRHNCTDFKWLDDHTKVKKFIYDNFKDSPNNYFISIYSILGRLGEKYFGVAKKYRDLMTQSNIKQGEKRGQNLLSETEKNNWLDWQTLKKFSDKNWNDEARLLHALYTDIPPRRVIDYALLKLSRKSVPETRKLDKEFNYLVMNKNHNVIAIVINRYKTAYKYGTYVINLTQPDDLPYFRYSRIKKLSKTLIEHENIKHNELIFPNTKGKSYGKDFGRNWINFLFENTGKKISVNLLRHSFVSYLLSRVNLSTMSDNSLKKISSALGHSSEMLLSYRRIDAKDAIKDFDKADDEEE